MTNLENAPNDFYLVYFIESHINTTTPKISISGDGGGLCGELKQVKQKIYTEPGQKEKFLYSIYQFKIYPEKIKDREKTELEIKLTLENEGVKFDQKITITDFDKDNYVYDFEFKSKGMLKKKEPPKAKKFSRAEQFEIFKDYLEKDLGIKRKIGKVDKKSEDLIFATQKLFKEKFWFNFYIIIFLECLSPLSWRKHFSYFDPVKIEGKGEIGELKKKRAKTFVKMVGGNPNKVLEGCKDDKDKEQSGIQLYTFVLYYYYEYDKQEFLSYLKKNDKNIRYYINNVLVKYSAIFSEQILEKERVQELIDISKTFVDFANILQYLDLLLELLEIILHNFDKFKNLYKEEKKINKSPKIDIETIIKPREGDKLDKIYKLYQDLEDKQINILKLKPKDFPISISGSILDEYIKFFNGKNLDYLFYIKDIKKKSKITDMEKDVNKSIFDTLLELSYKRKINNKQILEYIQKLIEDDRLKESAEIISGLDISTFNKEFYDEWKKVEWNKIIRNNEKLFIDKVLGLINDLKDFDILFNLLNINSKSDKTEIKPSFLEKMRIKFIELLKINKDTDCIKSVISLVVNSKKDNKEGIKTKEFLEQLKNILNEEKRKEIYSTLLSKHGKILNEEVIKFIIEFYTNDRDLNAKAILDILIECPIEIQSRFLDNYLNNYIPLEEEKEKIFLSMENYEKYILFKGLLDNGILNNDKLKPSFYIHQSLSRVKEIQNKLNTQDIKSTEISYFYNEIGDKENKQKIFNEKLTTIFLNDKNKTKEIKSKIDECFQEIKEVSFSLGLILEDFLRFFNTTRPGIIIELKEHNKNLTSGPINYYKKNKTKIDKLINEYKEMAEKRNKYKESIFFDYIYKDNKNKKDTNEDDWIENTEENFKKLYKMFDEKGIQSLEENLLKICVKAIKGKKLGEILKEIETLIKLFDSDLTEEQREQKNKIAESLLLLSRKEDVISVADAIRTFIEKAKLSKGKLWDLDDEIINNKKELNNEIKLGEYINKLKENKIDLEILYENKNQINNYLNILKNLNKQPDSIQFLIKTNDCKTLQDAAAENDEGLLTVNDIKEFEECVKFKNQLGDNGNFEDMNDCKFFESFQESVKTYEKIEFYFQKYIDNYAQLNDLFQMSFDKSGASKSKILSICENSEFTLKNEKGKFFKGFYYEKKGGRVEEADDNKKIINTYMLKELRDRAQLTKKVGNDDEEENQNYENFRKFVEYVSIIFKIYDLIKEIYSSGYVNDIEIKISIKKFVPKYNGCGLDTFDHDEVIKILRALLEDFIKKQKIAYRERPLIRYIYGRQFKLLHNKLYNKENNKKENNDIVPMLMYITNNKKLTEMEVDYKIEQKKDIFTNFDEYLKKILSKNKLELNKINKNNIIKKKDGENKYTGLYTFKADKLQKNVLQLYIYLTESNPKAQYILLCNKETTNEEVTAFLYRAIYCESNSCFIIAGIEFLQFKQKSTFQTLIGELYEKNQDEKEKKMKSCLIIAFEHNESDIVKAVFNLKYRKSIQNIMNILENMSMDNIANQINIINSNRSGVGKSTQIKLNIESTKREYIYFPLGGVFTRKDILKRLKELKENKNLINGTLHLDLYDTENIDLMMEFLFSVLITKIYGQNEDIFYLPKEVPIIVEIPNGFVDFIKKFPVLDIFETTTLKIDDLAPLIVPNILDSDVQIVANYLKLLKEDVNCINDNDIIFEGISPPDFLRSEHIHRVNILSQKECQKLIFEKINERIKQPNYYQITSFINLLGNQLRKFTQCYNVSAVVLREFRRVYPIIGDIRSFIIKNFIDFTKYFIEGEFINLVNNQKRTFQQAMRNFDEEEENKEAIQKLANVGNKENDLISFNKLDPSLLLFQEGNGEGFNIISNGNNIDEYKKYLTFMRVLTKDFNYDLPKLKDNDDQRLFLEQMQNILCLNNDIGKSEKEKKAEEQKNLIEGKKEVLKQENKKEEDKKGKDKEKKDKDKKDKEKHKNPKKIKDVIFYDDSEEEEEDEDEDEMDEEDNDKKEEEGSKKTLFDIKGNYVFTEDNFFKMALILLRIRANIPIIMMGETGCGKTFLIRKLSELYNQGDKNKMKILNIHAGTSDRDIIRFLEKKVIPPAKDLYEKEKKAAEEHRSRGQIYIERKFWVFLDEINTCKSMGLISEILCNHTYQGKHIPKNIAFIAACNPYRYDEKKIKNKAGLSADKAKKDLEKLNDPKVRRKIENSSNNKSLIYTVNPLPHSLLNFVFNFGNLTKEAEKKYITNIIKDCLLEFFEEYKDEEKLNEKDFEKIHELARDLIVASQEFIRERNDKSSVSLREIRRFEIFFKFFVNYLTERKKALNNQLVKKKIERDEKIDLYIGLKNNDIQIYSIILSVFVCYYLRIPDNQTRKDLVDKILNPILIKYDKNYSDFLKVPTKEEEFIAENIEMKSGIAKNRALLDNLFALFVTINTKVPIFIVGKPGCSKSLSVQLISKSMRGNSSNILFFKNYPRIVMSCFQGSMGSTSRGVKNVFKKARNVLKKLNQQKEEKEEKGENKIIIEKNPKKEEENNNGQEVISMIYFDEMGLAEHSPNNPLKVIHAELEYDLNEGNKKVAFVGISNWALDASKMNRGLYLSIPDPQRDDCKKTSFTIGASYDELIANNNKTLFENLGDLYFDYKKYLFDHFSNGDEEFHGNRDFYYLVKNVAQNIVNEKTNVLDANRVNNFVIEGIERNFAGLLLNQRETSLKRIKSYYRVYNNNVVVDDKYNVIERISQNIKDLKSRYLLVISKPSISEFLLTSILKEIGREYNYYKGSPFKEDQKSEEYILKILNKVQYHMEHESVLILNNLGTVYPGLYDLFNQNFIEVGNNNYARIAMGYTTNANSLVNENFRCIVNVEEDKISKEEPPFLNRFEKHIISFEKLLKQKEKDLACEIYKVLSELTQNDIDNAFKGIDYYLKDIFINLDIEEIYAYIYQLRVNNTDYKDMSDKVFKKFSLLLPQDIILYLKYGEFEQKNPLYFNYYNLLLNGYKEGEHNNLVSFFKKMKNLKNVIYTFSPIIDKININTIQNDILGEITSENITEFKISSFDSENQFEGELNDKFFNDEKKKLCIIKFNANERHFLNYVKFVIENKEKEIKEKKEKEKEKEKKEKEIKEKKENEEKKKAFVFIVNIERNFKDVDTTIEPNIIETDVEEIKNKYNETISLTSDFYQIFIDNLDGKEEGSLNEFLELKGEDFFKRFTDCESRFSKSIYETFMYMDYIIPFDFGEINKKNYVSNLVQLIQSEDGKWKNIINNRILKQMESDKNIIINAFKTKNLVSIYDTNILSSIQRYLIEIYSRLLNLFYYKAEKDQFFSTLLSLQKKEIKNENQNKKPNKKQINEIKEDDDEKNNNQNNNDYYLKKNDEEKEVKENKDVNVYRQKIIERAIEIYLDNLTFENIKENKNDKKEENKKDNKIINIVKEFGANKINIILGLQLPGIFPIISDLIKTSRNEIIKRYNANESNLRKYIKDTISILGEKLLGVK